MALALSATTTTLEASATFPYGRLVDGFVIVQYPGEPCPTSGTYPPMEGKVTLKRDGVVIADSLSFLTSIKRSCSGGIWSAGAGFFFGDVDFGEGTYTAEFSGSASLAPSVSAPVKISVMPTAVAQVPASDLVVKVGASAPDPNQLAGFYCAATSFQAALAPDVAPPPGVHFLDGAVRYDFSQCSHGCGFICPPDAPRFSVYRMLLEMPRDLPAHASVWVYSASVGMTTPVWRRVQSGSMSGARAKFILSGNSGEAAMQGWIAIATDDPVTAVEYQDQWWARPAESGWGLHLGQVDDRIFMGLYTYRDTGAPTWVVMPGGTWDTAHQVFSGSLYGPLGAPYQAYDTSMFRPGEPIGSARIRFANDARATLEYSIGSVSATKSIERLPFGTTSAPTQGRYAGLWWGGMTRNGWGLSIGHQDDNLFAVWYTYDANGLPTWFVMSRGVNQQATNGDGFYYGTLYRTSGPPWLRVPFDASKVQVKPVGSLSLLFAPGGDVAQMKWTVDGQSGTESIYRQPF